MKNNSFKGPVMKIRCELVSKDFEMVEGELENMSNFHVLPREFTRYIPKVTMKGKLYFLVFYKQQTRVKSEWLALDVCIEPLKTVKIDQVTLAQWGGFELLFDRDQSKIYVSNPHHEPRMDRMVLLRRDSIRRALKKNYNTYKAIKRFTKESTKNLKKYHTIRDLFEKGKAREVCKILNEMWSEDTLTFKEAVYSIFQQERLLYKDIFLNLMSLREKNLARSFQSIIWNRKDDYFEVTDFVIFNVHEKNSGCRILTYYAYKENFGEEKIKRLELPT